MRLLQSCFGVITKGNGQNGVTSLEASFAPVVADIPAQTELVRADVAGCRKSSSISIRHGNDAACKVCLRELQSAIVAIDEESFEVRCARMTRCVQQHFGPLAVVRLFGLAPDNVHLVQLAASAATPLSAACGQSGRSFTLHGQRTAADQATSLQADTACGFVDLNEGHPDPPPRSLLMERALSDQVPAVHRIDRLRSTPVEAGAQAAAWSERQAGVRVSGPDSACGLGGHRSPQPKSQPLDCLAELASLPGQAPLTFAALPLICGPRALGVLWVVVPGPHDPDGPQTTAPTQGSVSRPLSVTQAAAEADEAAKANATTAAVSTAQAQALLQDTTSLSQLALTVSAAMAAAAPDPHYVGWLASTVRRLAECPSVPALVAGVCSAVAQHVRRRFYADVAVQSALVPEADGHVAFLLYPETQQPLSSPPAMAVQSVGERYGSANQNFLSLNDGAAQQQQRSRGPNIIRIATDAPLAETRTSPQHRSAHTHHQVTQQPQDTALSLRAPGRPTSTSTSLMAGLLRGDYDGDSTASGSGSSVPLLRAKAYQTSHTLLLRLFAGSAQSKRLGASLPSAGRPPPKHPWAAGDTAAAASAAAAAAAMRYGDWVPPGIIVPDTARHVADVRQPSRDVCMLLGPRGMTAPPQPPSQQQHAAMAAGAASPGGRASHTPWASGPTSAADGCGVVGGAGGRSSASSLLLMGVEVADGGCMLGLYVAFPSLMPQPLLLAARDSCGHFLSQVVADLVRSKLRSAKLGPDFDTLRAGVPGSYRSTSAPRPRDISRQMGLPATASGLRHPSPPLQQPPTPNAHAGSSLAPGLLELHSGDAALEAASPFAAQGKTNVGNEGAGSPLYGTGAVLLRQSLSVEASAPAAAPWSTHPQTSGSLCGQKKAEDAARAVAATATIGTATTGTTTTNANNASDLPTNRLYNVLVPAREFPSGPVAAVHTASGPAAFPHSLMDLSVSTDPDPGAESNDPRVGPGSPHHAAMMTVHDLDDAWGMRGIMGTMVDIITTNLQNGAYGMEEATSGNEHACRATEGLEELSLMELLGHGASAVVFRGLLGTVPVAVKIMEMSDADLECFTSKANCLLGNYSQLKRTQTGGQQQKEQQKKQGLPAPNPGSQAMVGSLTLTLLRIGSSAALVSPAASVAAGTAATAGGDGGDRADVSLALAVWGSSGGPTGGSGRLARPAAARDTQSPSPSWSLRQLQLQFQRHEAREMRARQNMMRNATELAVMRSVSHVNIVQVHAVYDNVVMERPPDEFQPGAEGFSLRRLDAKNPDTGGSPICTAIVLELCDCGCLADVLEDRSFPAPAPGLSTGPAPASARRPASPSPPASQRSQSPLRHSSAGSDSVDMKGVYLTLLEIALALRHLHSRRLVHRDLKPANILLKSSPGDPRGWTCKLADFGFALLLDRQDLPMEPQDAYDAVSAFGESSRSSATGGGGGRSWYTVQEEACGTVTHMAPEAINTNSRIDDSVDVYSFGMICWELLCGGGYRPFRHLQPEHIPEAVQAGVRPPLPRNLPPAYRKLIISCWAQEPRRRPRAADIVSFIKYQLALLNEQ